LAVVVVARHRREQREQAVELVEMALHLQFLAQPIHLRLALAVAVEVDKALRHQVEREAAVLAVCQQLAPVEMETKIREVVAAAHQTHKLLALVVKGWLSCASPAHFQLQQPQEAQRLQLAVATQFMCSTVMAQSNGIEVNNGLLCKTRRKQHCVKCSCR
jgi:hypothetical protein